MGMLDETGIVGYRLSFSNQGKQFPFSVSVCTKHKMEVCRFRFLFAANK
jgi:hypothetical protein